MSPPTPITDPPHPCQGIGVWQGVALYVCAILGAGVLVLPGQVASLAGPASLLAWTFTILLSIPLAFTFARLATAYPDAGGVATYARHAFGDNTGGIAGWWYFIAGSVGQAIVPLTAGYYISDALGVSQRLAPAFAAVILGLAVLTALRGLRFGGTVQVVLAAGVAVVLAVAIIAAVPAIRWHEFTPFAPHGMAGVGVAVVVLFYAFSGWEAIAHLAGDFRDVRRDLPRATLLTLFVVAVLYLGVAFAVVGTHSYGDTELDNVALARVVGDQLGVSPAIAVALAATVICLGTTNAFLASVSRLGYALGLGGWAPRPLGRLNRRGAPGVSVIAVAAIGGAGLAGSALFGWGTDDLVYIPSTLVLTTYLVAAAAGIRLMSGRQRLLPAVAFVMIAVFAPSAGWYLLVPLGVAVAVLVLRRLRRSARL
ncbi:APC family permease [Nocardiopsis sp. Huas11]|uniref:APC family permease n=1 Tax=Nocardiopsis sp. Huas11 TaxID=2183912 RepID=UPI0018F62B27|nr:amino acid permease [Nocardiopsis sp. Huas11]